MTTPRERWTDEEFDRLWNGARPPSAEPEQRELARTATFVAAHDNTPGPRPEFTQRLRAELRRQAEETAMPPIAVSSSAADAPRVPLTTARGRRIGRAWGVVELTGAALLIAAMLIAAIGWDELPWRRDSNGSHLASRLTGSPPAAAIAASPIPAATVLPASGTLNGDMARTGQMPGAGPVGLAARIWQVAGDVAGETVVAGDRIITYQNLPNGANYPSAGNQQVLVVATDLATGATLWTTTLDNRSTYAAPSVANGLVYAPLSDSIVALDERTGAVVWTYAIGVGENSVTVAVADGLVYVTARDETLHAIDAMTGKHVWTIKIPASTTFPAMYPGTLANTDLPAVANGVVYVVGNGGLVLAADAKTGKQLWTYQAAADSPRTPMVADGRVVLTSGSMDATQDPNTTWIEAVDAKTGKKIWSRKESPEQTVIAAGDGALYLASGPQTGVVTAVDASDGKTVRWTYTATASVLDGLLANGVLYIGAGDGVSTGLDVKTGLPVWSVRLGTAGSPIPANGLAIIAGQGVITAVGGVQIPGTPAAAFGTPAAAPTARVVMSTPVDLSGLPPCNPPRKVPAKLPTGTPSATLDAVTKLVGDRDPGNFPQILVSNLPTGTPASAAEIAGMNQTLTDIANCMPPANESDAAAGFFTDDYFRRGWAGGGSGSYFQGWPSRTNKDLTMAIGATTVLSDGRIAAVITYNGSPHTLFVFAKQDGRWLIDERYLIVTQYKGSVG